MPLISKGIMWSLHSLYGDRPVPLWLLRIARWTAAAAGEGPDALLLPSQLMRGSSLEHASLAEQLAEDELGGWTLGVPTLNFLESLVAEHKPRVVLEFGSGISTVCLARYVSDHCDASDSPSVIAIEQDPEHAERTMELGGQVGVSQRMTVVFAPLRGDKHEQGPYQFEPGQLDAVLAGRQVDLLLVDGPAGRRGIRLHTLTSVRPYLREGATVLLDDALRDAELQIAQSWAQWGWLKVAGVMLMGKGLLIGNVVRAETTRGS